MRLPAHCRVRTIGYPWLAIREVFQPSHGSMGILFALSTFYDEFTPFIQAVVKAFPERTIIVRPHPNERDIFDASSAAKVAGIHIDTNEDIYDTFPVVDVVIGGLSTSLFEAIALGKRVFSKPSPRNKGVFADMAVERYESVAELVEKLKQPKPAASQKMQDALFERNWKVNYKSFCSEICDQAT